MLMVDAHMTCYQHFIILKSKISMAHASFEKQPLQEQTLTPCFSEALTDAFWDHPFFFLPKNNDGERASARLPYRERRAPIQKARRAPSPNRESETAPCPDPESAGRKPGPITEIERERERARRRAPGPRDAQRWFSTQSERAPRQCRAPI